MCHGARRPPELVKLIYDDQALAIIATDRNSSHLAEQFAVKAFMPMIAVSADRALFAANIPWIFRLPGEFNPEAAFRRLNRWLLRDPARTGRVCATHLPPVIRNRSNATAVIATDRNSSHLAEQLAVKAFVPLIAMSADRALFAANIPWIFRLPGETRSRRCVPPFGSGRQLVPAQTVRACATPLPPVMPQPLRNRPEQRMRSYFLNPSASTYRSYSNQSTPSSAAKGRSRFVAKKCSFRYGALTLSPASPLTNCLLFVLLEFDVELRDRFFRDIALPRERHFHNLVDGDQHFVPPVHHLGDADLLDAVFVQPVVADRG